jgi:O-antigen/teichoic acid export membrane protein
MSLEQVAPASPGSHGIPQRFLITLLAQASKSAFSFLSGMIVARGLGPTEYGNLAFLLGSFAGLRLVLDMSAGQAFFTLAAQRQRGRSFYIFYATWLSVAEIFLPLFFILLVLPHDTVSMLWQGEARERVWLAFAASTMQYLFWPQMIQLGEVVRRTHISQSLTIWISLAQFAIVMTLYALHSLTLVNFLITTTLTFLVGAALAFSLLPRPWRGDEPPEKLGEILREFTSICKPMVASYLLQAIQGWAEVWLIQHYSGARQQAYYALGIQISLIGLLATTSLQNIFWREVAEMEAAGDENRVRDTYWRTSRVLLFTAAVPVAFLILWATPIVRLALGAQYQAAIPAVTVLFLYPLTQCLTTPVFVLYYAMRRTNVLATVASITAILNIVGSYLVLAPAVGLNAGALGMAVRIVLLAALNFLVLEIWVCRQRNWGHDWWHRFRLLGVLAVISIFGRGVGALTAMMFSPAIALAAGAVSFTIITGAVFYRFPEWAGLPVAMRDRYLAQLWRMIPGRSR